jgi:hypothetical protein
MPKSRQRRKPKNRKTSFLHRQQRAQQRWAEAQRNSAIQEDGAVQEDGAAQENSADDDVSAAEFSPPRIKTSIRMLLFENEGELLFQIISYTPLLFGTWVAAGIRLAAPLPFCLLLAAIVVLHYGDLTMKGRLVLWPRKRVFIVIALALAVLFCGFTFVCRSASASVLLAAYIGLSVAGWQLRLERPRPILLSLAALIVRMSILPILGTFSQYSLIVPAVAVMGFVPAGFLAASVVARHADVFIRAGWHRSREVTKKKTGEKLLRPGALTQLYTGALVIGPVLGAALAPIGYLPSPFLLCAVPLYFMPTLANGFMECFYSDEVIAGRTLILAAFAAVISLVSGLLATAV